MRFSFLNSIILACIYFAGYGFSAVPGPEIDTVQFNKIKPGFKTVWYSAQVDVMGKHLSGLLLFKKFPDNTVRAVFTNEMGAKLFDFEYSEKNVKVIFCIRKLNKKAVVRQVSKDLGLVIFHKINPEKGINYSSEGENIFKFSSKNEDTYYITNASDGQLTRIENASKNKKKVIVAVSPYKNGLPETAKIEHQLFDFTISLQQIER